jgi:hypothetical protein
LVCLSLKEAIKNKNTKLQITRRTKTTFPIQLTAVINLQKSSFSTPTLTKNQAKTTSIRARRIRFIQQNTTFN